MLIALVGCEELPPEPGAPGAPIGKAAEVLPDWAAGPEDNLVVGNTVVVLAPENNYTKENKVAVIKEDFIYRYGYIFKNNQWEQFKFIQNVASLTTIIRHHPRTSCCCEIDRMPSNDYRKIIIVANIDHFFDFRNDCCQWHLRHQ